jgi:phenylacetate-CoA ligase
MSAGSGYRQRLARYPRYWDEARETMDPARREQLILECVQSQLRYAYERLPFYRRLYDAHGVTPADVRSLADYTARIPVVTKDMLRADQELHPPFGSYSGTELADITRIYGSSGTTGKPTIYGISRTDWERAEQAQAMAAWAMGVRPDDIVHFLFPFGMFIGGWAILMGTTKVGAANFPAGAMDSVRHIEMMRTLGSTVLAGTPSYCLHLGEVAKETGSDLAELGIHTLIVGGEPGGTLPGTREAIRQIFGDVRVIDTGNTSECFPTQMNSSCPEETGVHVFEDEVYLEVVDGDDPHTGMPTGARGTTVYTTLHRRSQPMLRFMAGDETYLDRGPCPCGRTYPRLPEGLLGRADDMLLIRGANVYPSAVENTLRQVAGVGAEYRLIVDKNGALDELSVESEYDPTWLSAQVSQPETARADLRARIEAALKRTIGLRCTVRLVPPGSHESQLFKARRVIDRREGRLL